MRDKLDLTRELNPLIRVLGWGPEIPVSVESKSIVGVQEILGYGSSFFRCNSGIETLLHDRRFAPGDRMQAEISDARSLFRKRKLSHDRDSPREDFNGFKVSEPET